MSDYDDGDTAGRHRGAAEPEPTDLGADLLGPAEPEAPRDGRGTPYPDGPGAGYVDGPDDHAAERWSGRRRRRSSRRRGTGCLPLLVVVLVLAVGAVVVWGQHGFENPVTTLGHKLKDAFSSDTKDYPGPGTGRVTFEVHSGDSLTTMGQHLERAGVVASVQAFTDAANANAKSTSIQPGFYYLKSKMKASAVVAILVDPKKVVSTAVTIPEGYTADQIVAVLAAKTKYSRRDFERVLAKPSQLDLPSYAGGRVEGYLFPATYDFAPNATPVEILRAMVTRFDQAAQDDGVVARAKALGYTPGQLVTVASLVQAEGRGADMPKIARVVYNRLSMPTAQTAGFLGIDATINYALGRNLGVGLTQQELNVDSPYNTRTHKGLPPGPIDSPGDEALLAAGRPTRGDWLYYVTVNLRTGKTLFSSNYQQFLRDKAQLTAYCETSKAC